jgi:hypothetical protein
VWPPLLLSWQSAVRPQEGRCDRGAPLRRKVTITDAPALINGKNGSRPVPGRLWEELLQEGHAPLNHIVLAEIEDKFMKKNGLSPVAAA